MQPFLRLLREAPPARALLLIGLMTLAGLSEGVGVLLLVPLLETLQGGQGGAGNSVAMGLLRALGSVGIAPTAGGILSAFLLLVALRSAVQFAREQLGANLQFQMVDQLRQRCFTALLGAEWRWLVTERRADHANLLLTEVNRVGLGLQFGLNLLATLATLLACLLAAFALSWTMTTLALGSGALVFWLLAGQRRKAVELGRGLGEANRAMQRSVQESLAGVKLAKILGSEERHLEAFGHITRGLRGEQLRFMAHNGVGRSLLQVGGAGLLALYLYAGLNLWQVRLAELLTLVVLFGRLIPILLSAQQNWFQWLHAMPALLEVERLLTECRASAEPAAPLAGPRAPLAQGICLHEVSVQYTGRDVPALDRVSLCLPARTTTAVMGSSGAGKSTLADLLMGLLAPDAGRLTLDGVELDGAGRMAWRRNVAYVPQDTFLFNDTIRNNLRWAQPDAGDAQLREALERAAADFVFRLPEGLETMVGDGGVRLSGGERQRLALARALLTRPALLILDEATSALDLENEARIRAAIEKLHGDLTVLVIGHRLSTLEHADRVVVLEAGRIAVQGSWSEVRALLKVA